LEVRNDFTHERTKDEVSHHLADESDGHAKDAHQQVSHSLQWEEIDHVLRYETWGEQGRDQASRVASKKMKRNMISSAMGVSFLPQDKVLGLMKSEILMIDLLAVSISSIE
jgi:hypothetical protein